MSIKTNISISFLRRTDKDMEDFLLFRVGLIFISPESTEAQKQSFMRG